MTVPSGTTVLGTVPPEFLPSQSNYVMLPVSISGENYTVLMSIGKNSGNLTILNNSSSNKHVYLNGTWI